MAQLASYASENGGSVLPQDSPFRSTERNSRITSSLKSFKITANHQGNRSIRLIPDEHSKVMEPSPTKPVQEAHFSDPKSTYLVVTITHITNPKNFYVRTEQQDILMKELQQILDGKGCESTKPNAVQVGDVYLVQVGSNRWKRGKCLSSSGLVAVNNIREVCFNFFLIDEGCEQNVPQSSVHKIPECVMEYPKLATKCQLNVEADGKWTIGIIRLFQQLTSRHCLKMTVLATQGEVLTVDLAQMPSYPDESVVGSIQDALTKYTQLSHFHTPNKFPVPFTNIKSGSILHGQITYMVNPYHIYIRLNHDSRQEFVKMHEEIQAQFNAINPDPILMVHSPQQGQVYAACRAYVWYRVIIEEIRNEEARVFCVDTGHVEKVQFQDLRRLNEKYLTIPAQVTRCLLSNVRPTEAQPLEKCHQFLRGKLRPGNPCRIVVTGIRPGSVGRNNGPEFTLCVTLYMFNEMQSINGQLISKGFSKETGTKTHTAGSPVKDSGIRELSTPTPSVKDSETRDRKCGIVEAFTPTIKMAPSCRSTTSQKPQTAEKECIKDFSSDILKTTTMPAIETSLSEDAIRPSYTHQLTDKTRDHRIDGRVTLASNPNYFYVRTFDKTFRNLNDQLQVVYNSSGDDTLAMQTCRVGKLNFDTQIFMSMLTFHLLGDACAVRFDGVWRRALVEIISERDKVSVFLVDTGQRIPVFRSDLRRLKEVFMEHATQVALCKLTGVRSVAGGHTWPDDSIHFFLKRVLNKEVSFYSEHVFQGSVGRSTSSKEMSACVVMYVRNENESINTQMVQSGFAICIGYLEMPHHRARQEVETVESPSGIGVLDQSVEICGTMPKATDYVVAVKFLSCLSSDAIYVRPLVYREAYEKTVKEMQMFYSTHVPSKPTKMRAVGTRCAALVDGKWVRALVTDVAVNFVCSIINVDTGQLHRILLENTVPLAEQFAAVPNLAIRCTLNGFDKSMPPPGIILIISALMSADEVFISCAERPKTLSDNLKVDIIFRCYADTGSKIVNLKHMLMKPTF